MSTKKDHSKLQGINWPKTPERRAVELEAATEAAVESKTEALQNLATVGQLMSAANAIPHARTKKLITDSAAAAAQGTIGGTILNRKQRRAAQKQHATEYLTTNKAWDEVNDIYETCVDLLRTNMLIMPMLKERDLILRVKNKGLLTRLVNAITSDTKYLITGLGKIKDAHKNKSGGSVDQDDMMNSCKVFTAYVEFMEHYEATLMPLVVHAAELLQEALLILKQEQPEYADGLTKNINNVINNIAGIVHKVTGAPDIAPMAEEPAAEQHAA